jgi:hypothetical protein
MNVRHAAVLSLFACFSFPLMACGDRPKPEHHYALLEVIDVKGTCYEDHAPEAGRLRR